MSDTATKSTRSATASRVTLRVPEAPAILHILASRAKRDAIAKKLDKLAGGGSFVLRLAGPDKWLALAPAAAGSGVAAEINRTLASTASLLDQSDGRVLIEISGAEAREALAKGTGVDLDPSVFPVGHSVITAFGHVTVHLTRSTADAYELIVMRSYAETLWETLREAAQEFGCDAPATLPEAD